MIWGTDIFAVSLTLFSTPRTPTGRSQLPRHNPTALEAELGKKEPGGLRREGAPAPFTELLLPICCTLSPGPTSQFLGSSSPNRLPPFPSSSSHHPLGASKPELVRPTALILSDSSYSLARLLPLPATSGLPVSFVLPSLCTNTEPVSLESPFISFHIHWGPRGM